MRIAVHATGAVAARAARMVLAERDLEGLGLIDRSPTTSDRRVHRVTDLSSYDVVLSDDPENPAGIAAKAEAAGIACVLWHDGPVPWSSPATLLAGANLASGIAPALASHEEAVLGRELPVTIAWTEPGRPLGRGIAAPFPDPLGALWAEDRSNGDGVRRLAAPVAGEWAGALVMVGNPREPERIVGVADDAEHLEAIALAAGAVTVARGRYPGGSVSVDAAAEDYLLAAIAMGLEVAGFAAH